MWPTLYFNDEVLYETVDEWVCIYSGPLCNLCIMEIDDLWIEFV